MRNLAPFLLFLAAPLAAQRAPIAPVPSVLFEVRPAPVMPSGDSVTLQRPATDFQNAVSILGGAAGAIGSYVFLAQDFNTVCTTSVPEECFSDRVPMGWRLVGSAAGGAAGYLITRGMAGRWSKDRPAVQTAQMEVPKDTGVKWWQGAVLGTVVGGAGIVVAAKTLRWEESGDGIPAVAFAPLGALLGLVVGGSLAQAH